jgi:tetratricopeptide (TPR) repeat protein
MLSVELGIEEEFQDSITKRHLDEALEYAYNDEPEKALEECEIAKSTMPSISIACNYLGMILETLNQLEPAIDSYLKAIEFIPRFYAARENLGNARVNLEEEQLGFGEMTLALTNNIYIALSYLKAIHLILPCYCGCSQ